MPLDTSRITMPITADNFGPAWNSLVARYENKRAIVSAHLDRFFAIAPIARKSVSDLKALVSTVKETLGGLGALHRFMGFHLGALRHPSA